MQHKSYSIGEVAEIVNAKRLNIKHQLPIRNISFDSRKLADREATLFFALKARRDGHAFIKDAYQDGVRSFVVSETSTDWTSLFPEANFIWVDDTNFALQQLVAKHRQYFNYPVIGITGSNGKTIVKEWLYQLLAPEKYIIRSPKSYNSQIGVPLSVWGMADDYQLAIFEAGISKKGEMQQLAKVIDPTIGVLTNIGDAHNEGFDHFQEKISEKLQLFQHVDCLIYNPKYLKDYQGIIPGGRHFTWGDTAGNDLQVKKIRYSETDLAVIDFVMANESYSCKLPFSDAASIENAICCMATLLSMGYSPQTTIKRMGLLHPVKMRLELKKGINQCSIIDDSYSADFSSLSIALDFLNQQQQHQTKTLILSDIKESGVAADQLYARIAGLLAQKGINRLIGVGEEMSSMAHLFNLQKHFFANTEDLLQHIYTLKFQNESILLKGARSFEFEKVSQLLAQKVHQTVLEINLNALEHNLNYYKSQLRPGVKIMIMVKAFSYGSGSYEVANLLQYNKVDYLAVAYADEGVTLRKAGITLPIMVMNPDFQAFDLMISYNLEPEIYSFRVLHEFVEILKEKEIEEYPIHLKLDTGMHRLGFVPEDEELLLQTLQQYQGLKIKSIFSHLVASEDPDADPFTQHQLTVFKAYSEKIQHTVGYKAIRHICNTSGISRHPDAQLDMVRLGIGLYGFDSSKPNANGGLQTVTTLKTSISQIKQLKAGETVGYNRRGVLLKDGKIATVKIGYADGYSRKLGNGVGKMLVNGQLVPTIGNICMDMCMLDISAIEANEGDEVIVFNEQLSVREIARELQTIPYEVLTGISERVKRVYYYE